MNILQIHDMVKFWIDEYQSPRQSDERIDQAIWSASKSIVDEKYDHSKQNHPNDSIERFQRVRDELYTLVNVTPNPYLAVTNNNVPAALIPEGYKYLLLLEAGISVDGGTGEPSDGWQVIFPVTTDQRRDFIRKNPYRKPKSSGMFELYYYWENINGFDLYVENDATGIIEVVKMTYLKEPVENFIGTTRAAGYTPSSNTPAIAKGDLVYDGDSYNRGDSFTISSGTTFAGEDALTGFTNSDLPITLHEEIAKKAAVFVLESVNLYEKAMQFKQDILSK